MTQAAVYSKDPDPVRRVVNTLKDYDAWLMGSFAILACLGLVMVASASISLADRSFHAPLHYFSRQLFSVGLGLFLAFLTMKCPLRLWERASIFLLFIAILLLALVLVPGLGRQVNGSVRWLRLGPISVQASEPAKLFFMVYVASYIVRHQAQVRETMLGLVKPVAVLALVALLLLLEPDYGATVVLFATTLGMLFMGGVSLIRFSAWGLAAVVALGVLAIQASYRMERLMSFLDPWADPFNKGFQLTQALIAFGRGEWFGVGLGGSIQKLFYLPEAHTDFIVAVLAEELGFAGILVIIALFYFVVYRAFSIGRSAERGGQLFSAYLAYGIGLLIGIQAFINMGVNMGVLPTKGLTLPLVSYGNNSVIVICVAFGLLLRIDYEARAAKSSAPRWLEGERRV
jgi:cell division protein FtsW